MSQTKILVVTGANRGIGKAIVAKTAASPPHVPLVIYAGSRAGNDLGIKAAPQVTLRYPQLDISQSDSIRSLVQSIKSEHGTVDCLINNAGINLDTTDYNSQNVEKTLNINYRGTLNTCQQFIPIMATGGRIVNLSSIACQLDKYSPALQQRFRNPNMTLQELDGLMNEFQECANTGTEKARGWTPQAYSASKAGVTALTAILARHNPQVQINCCCPGWVATDMGSLVGSPSKTPDQGAMVPLKLAFGDIGDTTGRYWANPSVSSTGAGQIMAW